MKISPKRNIKHILMLTNKEVKTLSMLLVMELMEEKPKKQSIIGKDRRYLEIIYELTKK